MDIQQSTIEAAIELLNVHKEYCRSKETGTNEQKAYYKGLSDMAELILTNHFTHNGDRIFIDVNELGNLRFKVIQVDEKKEADI